MWWFSRHYLADKTGSHDGCVLLILWHVEASKLASRENPIAEALFSPSLLSDTPCRKLEKAAAVSRKSHSEENHAFFLIVGKCV